jgi:putative ABC transport system substrate-binding protein
LKQSRSQGENHETASFLQVFASALGGMPFSALAQTNAKTYRIGTLTVGAPIPPTAGTGKILIDGLEKRGFKLGDNLVYESRGAAGKVSQVPNLMQELKGANVDVVVTVSYPAAAPKPPAFRR